MGTPHRPAPAVHLSPPGAEPAGRRGAVEHEGPGRGVTVEDRPGPRDRADLLAGAAGQTAKAAGSGEGCGAGA